MDWEFVLVGLLTGLLVGMTGMGGGSLMTPILVFLFGIPPATAIGTDIAHGAAFKTVGAVQHRRMGNVRARLAGWMLIGSAPMSLLGVWVGVQLTERYGDDVKSVMGHSAFLRMMLAVTLLVGVRAAFLYWAVLSPKYWYRAIGPDARVGLLGIINPIVIVAGLFLLVPIINRFSTFKMLTYGALLAALSFFPMAVPWYWLSNDPTVAYYAMSAIAMLAFSVGEIMFSPRLTHYIVAIAPVGQEGVYSSFSAMPWFIGKTIAGFFSGILLTKWCPEKVNIGGIAKPLHDAIANRDLSYTHSPEMMWLILGIAAIIGPLVMIPLKGWFTKGMRHRVDEHNSGH